LSIAVKSGLTQLWRTPGTCGTFSGIDGKGSS
jgi:hypothetical protein